LRDEHRKHSTAIENVMENREKNIIRVKEHSYYNTTLIKKQKQQQHKQQPQQQQQIH
jgi:hypothetical protein